MEALTLTDYLFVTIIFIFGGASSIEAMFPKTAAFTKLKQIFSKEIHTKLDGIKRENETQHQEIKDDISDNEKSRLRARIVDFANDLRNKEKKSTVQFKNIFECFDKYIKHGGNSYVKTEMGYIKSVYKERGK